MWTFEIRTGRVLGPDGTVAGYGYSGHDAGKDNPAMEAVAGLGPVPEGRWQVDAPFFHPLCGPYAMRLVPLSGTDTFGRAGFLIHGDSIQSPGTASHGCIILPRQLRMAIWESNDHEITVVSGEQVQESIA